MPHASTHRIRWGTALVCAFGVQIGSCQCSSDADDTTQPPTPPTSILAPTLLLTLTVSQTEIDVIWIGNNILLSVDFGVGERFEVHRCQSSAPGTSCTPNALVTTRPDDATWRDTGLTPGIEYCYHVVATWSYQGTNLTSPPSAVRCATTDAPPPPPPPPPPPASATLAFDTDRDGNDEIYVINVDGTGEMRITNDPGADNEPAWSPDGMQIAFDSDRNGDTEIYLMAADGSGQVRRTTNAAADDRPDWSLDGTRITWERTVDGSSIMVMNADGTGATSVRTNAFFNSHPAWSPDGTRIAFSSDMQGAEEIYVMNADGTGATQITSNGM